MTVSVMAHLLTILNISYININRH